MASAAKPSIFLRLKADRGGRRRGGGSDGVAARNDGTQTQLSPLVRRLVAVFMILAISVFAFPGGLTGWLYDRNRAGWLDAPLAAMRAVDAVSSALGVKGIGQRLRQGFRNIVGDDEG